MNFSALIQDEDKWMLMYSARKGFVEVHRARARPEQCNGERMVADICACNLVVHDDSTLKTLLRKVFFFKFKVPPSVRGDFNRRACCHFCEILITVASTYAIIIKKSEDAMLRCPILSLVARTASLRS